MLRALRMCHSGFREIGRPSRWSSVRVRTQPLLSHCLAAACSFRSTAGKKRARAKNEENLLIAGCRTVQPLSSLPIPLPSSLLLLYTQTQTHTPPPPIFPLYPLSLPLSVSIVRLSRFDVHRNGHRRTSASAFASASHRIASKPKRDEREKTEGSKTESHHSSFPCDNPINVAALPSAILDGSMPVRYRATTVAAP